MADEPTATIPAPTSAPLDATTGALIERVRKEEKAKLYDTMQRLEARIEELQKPASPTTSPAADPALTEQVKALQRQLVISEERYNALLENERNSRAKLQLDLYTERKINELRASGTGFIPRLITGNSIAEIDAAIIESVKIYAEIHQTGAVSAEAKLKGTPLAAGTSSGPRGADNTPPPANPGLGEEISAEAIANMSTQDWARERERLLQKAGKRS